MKERIGVKFCGQCNPRLKLRSVYDLLPNTDGQREYYFYDEETDFDKVIILCGCPSECADISRDIYKFKLSPRTEESAHSMALRVIENISEK